jgi:IS5 family transposase
LTAANVNEPPVCQDARDALPTVAKQRGRPRWKPDRIQADKGYDSQANRDDLTEAGRLPRIARRGIESRQKWGKYRWVIERTFAWRNRFRRLKIRYERRDDIHEAFLLLGCALICWNFLQK